MRVGGTTQGNAPPRRPVSDLPGPRLGQIRRDAPMPHSPPTSSPATTLPSVLALHGRHLGTKPAIVEHGGGTYSYAELAEATAAVAALLEDRGIGPGEVVAVAAEASAASVATLGGIMAAGAIAAPVNTRLGPTDLSAYLASVSPSMLLVGTTLPGDPPSGLTAFPMEPGGSHGPLVDRLGAAAVEARPRPDPDLDAGAIAFPTGGTTGSPKAALRTHRALVDAVVSNVVHLEVRRVDRELYLAPLFHLSVVSGLWPTLYAGGTVSTMSRFDATEAAASFAGFAPTRLLCTPTVMDRIVGAAAGLTLSDDEFRIAYGAARNAPDFFERVRTVLPRARLVTGYGATEFGAVTRLYPEDPEWGTDGAVGRPVAGVAIEVVDDDGEPVEPGTTGEIVVASPFAMARYLGHDEDPFTDAGAIRSGDLGHLSADGCLFLTGRRKELIITGGENVFPGEVESVLNSHPAVEAAAVFGVDDDRWGERVEAAVVRSAAVAITEEQLRRHCGAHLAGFKVPKAIRFVDELPYTPTMKVDRRRLRDVVEGGRP